MRTYGKICVLALCGVLPLFSLAGCSLLEDATSFTVCTDPQEMVIDSAQFGVAMPVASIPAIDCSSEDVCAQVTDQLACGGQNYDCQIACGTSGNCQVEGTAYHYTPVDLSKNDDFNSKVGSSALDKVTLERVEYTVTENTLNFDTPALAVYVGPTTALKPADSGVTAFTTMPAVPAGTQPQGALSPTSEGQAALSGYVQNYQTPFHILGSASMVFENGAALPTGRMTATIRACFQVNPL
ncbi:MAG: hypothetical protein JRH20_26930 [Deltaproteobacteria bacterium]|nr:hypothetical protein [Deltaproteobacteria bacterium]